MSTTDPRANRSNQHVGSSAGDPMFASWHEMRNKLAELHAQTGDAALSGSVGTGRSCASVGAGSVVEMRSRWCRWLLTIERWPPRREQTNTVPPTVTLRAGRARRHNRRQAVNFLGRTTSTKSVLMKEKAKRIIC